MAWSRKKTSSRQWNNRSRDRTDGDDTVAVRPRTGDDGRANEALAEPRSKRTNPRHPAWDGEGFAGGVVTRVALQQRSGTERLNIFLDAEYAFSVAAVVGVQLREGIRLERAQIDDMLRQDENERAYERSLSFLSARPRSKAEVRRRLREAGLPPQAIDSALERLEGQSLVNDEQFASYWVSQRMTFRPHGSRALRSELRAKGIDAETVATALEPIADGQIEAACRAAEKKARRLTLLDERTFSNNVMGFLVRRGFDYGVARTAARQLWTDQAAQSGDRE